MKERMMQLMSTLWDDIQLFVWNIIHRPSLVDWLDILIVAFILYELVMLTRQTRAIQVLKGLFILIVASYLSSLVGMTALNWLLRTVLNSGAIVLVIGGILLCLLIAFLMERKTKQMYFNHEKTENDWSIFDDDDEDDNE